MGRDDDDLANRPPLAAIPALEADGTNSPVGPDLEERRRRLLVDRCALRFGSRQMDRGIVFGLDRADGNAASVAAAGGALGVDRVARLWRRAHLVDRALESLGVDLVEIGLRDRRHRISTLPGRTERLAGVAGDTDLLLGFTVEFLEIRLCDRPVDTLAIGGFQGEVIGKEAKTGAEPVPGRAADDLDVGAFELVRPGLLVPEVRVVADRVHRFRRWRVWAFRNLDQGVPIALDGRAAIDPGARFEDGDLDPGGGEPCRHQRSRYSRPDDQNIG